MFGGLGIHKSYNSFDDAILFYLEHLKSFEYFNNGSNGIIFKAVLKPNVESPFISPLLKGVYTLLVKCMRISSTRTMIKKGNTIIKLNPVNNKEIDHEIKIQHDLFLCGIKKGFRLTPCLLGKIKPSILKKYVNNKLIDQLYHDTELQIICMESISTDLSLSDMSLTSSKNKNLLLFVMARACQILQCGVVHGDLFENNILINNKDREIIIIDFGNSKKVTPIKEINVETTIKMIDLNLEALTNSGSTDLKPLLVRCKKLVVENQDTYMETVKLLLSTKQEFHKEYLDAIKRI